MDAAACIACGAACKNASAMLFVSAAASRFAMLPQGQPKRKKRAEQMVAQMDAEGFGTCSFTGACAVECPASVSLENITRLDREYISAKLTTKDTGS